MSTPGSWAEDSELITVVERQFVVPQVQRQKYRCTCGVGLVTAPAPLKPVPGGRYSLPFAIHVAVQKYLDHLPLDRQRRAMQRLGLEVTTQTLWDRIEALARLWQPVYSVLRDYILGGDVVGVDETWGPRINESIEDESAEKRTGELATSTFT